jgi:hypothetical protein
MSEISVKRLESADGKRRVEIMARDNGTFRFVEWYELIDIDEINGTTRSFVPCQWSGLHVDARSAEAEARETIPWLREQSSN